MKTRREFLVNSAKFTALAVVGTSTLASLSFAAGEKGVQMQFVTLNNGIKMPILGYGTSRIKDEKIILKAIKAGYRLIDSAQMYGNEEEVGLAVKNSGIKREEFFITTKLSSDMSYEETLKSFELSMKKLKLDYLDLLLIHSPYSQAKQMYKAMEKLYGEGRIKALGVSNFKADFFSDFVKSCQITPAVNQCQTHIFHQQKPLRAVMQKYGTVLESWSPFVMGKNNFFENENLKKIAKKYNKTVAQVVLRFLIEQGIIVIPKTTNEARMRENLAVFDFALDAQDIKTLNAMDTGKSQFGWDS